jgi:uncharacterized phage protein (TIGR01671 family)
MREIKFRGRCIKSGDLVIGDLIHGIAHKTGRMYILPPIHNLAYVKHCDPLDGVEVDKETVGQFTGLKDKNGNEAYEKDFDADGNMIDWCDRCCGYQFKLIDIPTKDEIFCHNCEGNFMLHDHLPDFEIIGNIYQNPELIET